MNSEDLALLKNWFLTYVDAFQSRKPDIREAVLLKVEHTEKVCKNVLLIAKEQHLTADKELCLAEAVALMHDIGRFEQYERYGTFDDRNSVNHGKLGAEIIIRKNPLGGISDRERKIILDSVRFHNTLELPSLNKETILYLKLLRDADKLDIWRVMVDAYEKGNASSSATLGLPEAPECSDGIITAIMNKRTAQMSQVRTINDLKLVHLSWVFTLNFPVTYRLLAERKYISRTAATLPASNNVLTAVSVVKKFAEEKQRNIR